VEVGGTVVLGRGVLWWFWRCNGGMMEVHGGLTVVSQWLKVVVIEIGNEWRNGGEALHGENM